MPSEKRKARKQNYYKNVKVSRRIQEGKVLREGMKGFLLTCNNREKETVREAYSLFNQFADKMFGPETVGSGGADQEDKVDQNSEEEEDIDAAFDKEKTELIKIKEKASGERRFQMVDSNARNCVFIKTTLEDPEKLALDIIDNILETGIAKARYILRMVPILGTCKAHEKNIEDLAKTALPQVFGNDSKLSYSILFKTRNNNSVGREEVIKILGAVIRELPGETSVELKTPDVAIVVEIVGKVCCLGVARDYFGQRRKYNLVELLRMEDQTNQTKDALEQSDQDKVEESSAANCTSSVGTVKEKEAIKRTIEETPIKDENLNNTSDDTTKNSRIETGEEKGQCTDDG